VLAVDGGNAKTDLALLRADGTLLAVVRGRGSSPHFLGLEGSAELLDGLLATAVARAGLQSGSRSPAAVAVACILLAGVDLPEERASARARIEQMRIGDRLVVDNDTPALLRAGTDRGWGVAVVCGAGINGLGLAPDGREARFLSLGTVSGDWGGGGDVGLAAVAAAARGADGRGPHTILETAVPAHFELPGPLEVSRALHVRELPMARLAELAPVVLAAADHDAVAAGIVGRLAEEVIAFAGAALTRLELTQADPDVVLGGRLLRSLAPDVIASIASGVRELAPRARVLAAPSEPIVGAALLGLDALGADEAAKARARADLDAAAATLDPSRDERRGDLTWP
jgi:N-acetylglucosamine kinase-like BadF-type ATPase